MDYEIVKEVWNSIEKQDLDTGVTGKTMCSRIHDQGDFRHVWVPHRGFDTKNFEPTKVQGPTDVWTTNEEEKPWKVCVWCQLPVIDHYRNLVPILCQER